MADKSPSIGAIENALDELIDEMTDDDVLGMIAEDVSEPFQVELEEDLFHDYELYTLFKPNTDNYNKYSQRYNLICRQLERIGDKKPSLNLFVFVTPPDAQLWNTSQWSCWIVRIATLAQQFCMAMLRA